jgi:alkylation response protein AidB-like acyl-CoA dehydrogenase
MNSFLRPESELKMKHLEIISESAARAEKDGRLTKAQLNLIYEQNWFKMLAPSSLGGLQTPIPDALKLLESLAVADGSAGWTVTRNALAGWLSGFMNQDVAKELLAGDKVCIAGANVIGGTAEKTKSGYTVSGKWQQASGSGEATAFVGNCSIVHNGGPVNDETNNPLVLTFAFLKNEVTILPAWNAMGLTATAGNDFEVTNLKVHEERAFKVAPDKAKVNARLYQYPFLQLAEAALAVNISGMAFHFVDCYQKTVVGLKTYSGASVADDLMATDTLEKYMQRLNDSHMKLYYAVELTWQACINQQPIKDTVLYKVSAAAQDLTKKARECADALYPLCGIGAMDKGSEINRVWRDLHTASHESLLVFGGL